MKNRQVAAKQQSSVTKTQRIYLMHPVTQVARHRHGEHTIHLTGMVWSGGISAASQHRLHSVQHR